MNHPLFLEAMEEFKNLYADARALDVHEPDAVCLATCDAEGRPAARIVLLRIVDEHGFVFFTNSTSRKGQHLAENPRAALCLYWDAMGKQVRIEGDVEHVADAVSDQYWAQRARRSQIASAASQQSHTLAHPREFQTRMEQVEQASQDQEVARPQHWFGYRVVPNLIEFWTNGPNRMHLRTVYVSADGDWTKRMLYP